MKAYKELYALADLSNHQYFALSVTPLLSVSLPPYWLW